ARGVAVDRSGNVVSGGTIGSGSYDFGGGSLTGTDFPSIYVAKYSPTGSFVWAKVFGSTAPFYGMSTAGLATTANGDVIVTGGFSNTVNFGCGPLAPISGFFDTFVARVTASSGACTWAETFP